MAVLRLTDVELLLDGGSNTGNLERNSQVGPCPHSGPCLPLGLSHRNGVSSVLTTGCGVSGRKKMSELRGSHQALAGRHFSTGGWLDALG
jgi:hypothetical protein